MGRDQAAAMLNIFAERCQRLSQAGGGEEESVEREREREVVRGRERVETGKLVGFAVAEV